jgi:hypothetical protein
MFFELPLKLPLEVVYKILDMYSDSVGAEYMALRSVNKSIYAYIISSAGRYIRHHCYSTCQLTHDTFVPYLHEQLLKCDPLDYMDIRLRHKYLPVLIAVVNSGLAWGVWNEFRIANCYIYIGKREIAFDIYRSPPFGRIAFIPVRYVTRHHYSWVMDFLKEYFSDLYTYVTPLPRAL